MRVLAGVTLRFVTARLRWGLVTMTLMGRAGRRSSAVAVLVVLSFVVAGCTGGGHGGAHSPPPPANQAPAGSANSYVQDPVGLVRAIQSGPNSEPVKFDTGHATLNNVFSHTQGYARYRGPGYDYHIFTYSNLSGHYGYMYIASNNPRRKSVVAFTLNVPKSPIQFRTVAMKGSTYNPHFNHPCGIQVIGDYLVVPVIPFYGTFYNAAIVYLWNLSSLKHYTPSPQTRAAEQAKLQRAYKEILRIPVVNGGSLSSAGITRLPGGSGEFADRFLLGLVSDNKLDLYLSSKTHSVWEATWQTTQTTPPAGCKSTAARADGTTDDTTMNSWSKKAVPRFCYTLKATAGSNHYQGNNLFLDQQGDVYMMAFDARNSGQWVDLFSLTAHGSGSGWKGSKEEQKTVEEKRVSTTSLATRGTVTFRNAGSLEIRNKNDIWVYAVGKLYGCPPHLEIRCSSGGGITINYFK